MRSHTRHPEIVSCHGRSGHGRAFASAGWMTVIVCCCATYAPAEQHAPDTSLAAYGGEAPWYLDSHLGCGAKAAWFLHQYFGGKDSLTDIASGMKVDLKRGTSLQSVHDTLARRGLYCRPVRCNFKHLKTTSVPCVATLYQKKGNHISQTQHYVVLMGYTEDGFKVVEPFSSPYLMPESEMKEVFAGSAILVSDKPLLEGNSHHVVLTSVACVVLALALTLAWKRMKARSAVRRSAGTSG